MTQNHKWPPTSPKKYQQCSQYLVGVFFPGFFLGPFRTASGRQFDKLQFNVFEPLKNLTPLWLS